MLLRFQGLARGVELRTSQGVVLWVVFGLLGMRHQTTRCVRYITVSGMRPSSHPPPPRPITFAAARWRARLRGKHILPCYYELTAMGLFKYLTHGLFRQSIVHFQELMRSLAHVLTS